MQDSDLLFAFWRFWEKKTWDLPAFTNRAPTPFRDIPTHNLIKVQMGLTLIIQTFAFFICMMKCHHGITRLNNLESHDLIAFILIQLYLGNQVFVTAVSPVQGWPWVWAVGRGASYGVFSCTASDVDLICYFPAQIPSLSPWPWHSSYSIFILSIFGAVLCQFIVSTSYCTT